MVSYAILVPMWTYTRVFCFGNYAYDMFFNFRYPEHLDPNNMLSSCVIAFTTALAVLNCMWAIQQASILRKLINEHKQGKFTFFGHTGESPQLHSE